VFSGAFHAARRARRGASALGAYARKMLLPQTWGKLLKGRLNLPAIRQALGGDRTHEDAAATSHAPDTATGMQRLRQFSGPPALRVWQPRSGNSPARGFYQQFVNEAGMEALFHDVDGANHNFYGRHWQQEVIHTTLQWLAERGRKYG